ncbi:MAG: hypothetical protein ACLUVF_06460 [Adlercreutzia sp.]
MEDARHFDPVAWINTPRWQASRLGLSRMVDLLERLGRPQDELRFVHVAGTNGKGSVCAYVASVRRRSVTAGLFTIRSSSASRRHPRERREHHGRGVRPAVAAVRSAAAAVEAACGIIYEFELWPPWLEHFRAVGAISWCWKWGSGGGWTPPTSSRLPRRA